MYLSLVGNTIPSFENRQLQYEVWINFIYRRVWSAHIGDGGGLRRGCGDTVEFKLANKLQGR